MPSIREIAVGVGLRASRRFSGSPVVYSRGNVSLSISHAVKRSDDFVSISRSGQEQIIAATVWRIQLDEMEALGDPAIGDIITDEDGVEYKVESPGDGVLHWAETDVGATELTIYTRQSGVLHVNSPTQRDLQGNEVRRP